MMVQPVITRTQRRIERKQIILIIILILAVAGASFALGVMFGQRSKAVVGPVAATETAKPPVAAQVVPVPPPPPAAGVAEKQDKLTFYDNLPKGNQAPLGSGINLPPEERKPSGETKPNEPTRPAATTPGPSQKQAAAPAASPDGAFIVQIASFRSSADADKLVQRLNSYQIKGSVEKVDLGAKGLWYRVLAGPYPNRANADQVAGLLRDKERMSALVRQR
jgi:cell division septation protein DedD